MKMFLKQLCQNVSQNLRNTEGEGRRGRSYARPSQGEGGEKDGGGGRGRGRENGTNGRI